MSVSLLQPKCKSCVLPAYARRHVLQHCVGYHLARGIGNNNVGALLKKAVKIINAIARGRLAV